MGDIEVTLGFAVAQQGVRYEALGCRFGNCPNHYCFDCSGLCWRALVEGGWDGAELPTTSVGFLQWGLDNGTRKDWWDAQRGDLLIRGGLQGYGPNGHVCFYLGNGVTMEAMGTAYGCRLGSWSNRGWSDAITVPGITPTGGPKPAPKRRTMEGEMIFPHDDRDGAIYAHNGAHMRHVMTPVELGVMQFNVAAAGGSWQVFTGPAARELIDHTKAAGGLVDAASQFQWGMLKEIEVVKEQVAQIAAHVGV